MLHRIREMYKETAPDMLIDVVEIDETLVGGKNKNRHADKKKEGSQGGRGGDKSIVLGAKDIGGRVKTKVVPNVETETLQPVIEKWVQDGAITVTDELKSYRALSEKYFHISIDHSAGQYATGAFSTNGIENFWSLFKRGIIGIYHQVSPKHLQRYSTEFAYRYNTRKETSIQRFTNALKAANSSRLKYRDLTKD